jgi:hypothetical protein
MELNHLPPDESGALRVSYDPLNLLEFKLASITRNQPRDAHPMRALEC